MAPRWRHKGKSDPSDEADKAGTVVVLTSSDDEEANEDLSLAVVEKAKQSKAKRKTAEASLVIPLDETDLDNKEADKTGGEGSRKKKRVKKKKERDVTESETPQAGISEGDPITAALEVRNLTPQGGVAGEEPLGTVESVLPEENEAPDNKVLRRLLRGTRYFDPGETHVEMCFNCGREGHLAFNCTAERKKKPCFRCGQFGHAGKDCTQGQYCYTCKKSGHKARDCPEKNKKAYGDSKVCLKCCDVGHDMFSCANSYPPEDMKEIQCYVCKKEGHLCCHVMSDSSSPNVVSCYNCAELGHTGTGCAKPRRETGTVVSSILCYKCGEEGHFARGCRITNKSIVRSVLGITPKSKKSKMRDKERRVGFKSAPEKRKGMQYDRKGNTSASPKSFSPKKYKPNSRDYKERSYRNSGYERDYSTPHSSDKRRWQGYASPKSDTRWNQHKPRYSESRFSNSHTRFQQS